MKLGKRNSDISSPNDPRNISYVRDIDVYCLKIENTEETSYRGTINDAITVEVLQGNIVQETTDAITNAANELL